MLLLANVLLLLACAPLLLMVANARPTRAEGFVGFHMVTGPLAIGQVAAVALGIAAAPHPSAFPAWIPLTALPGYLLALTALPFAAFGHRWRHPSRAGVVAAVLGCVLAVNGATTAPAMHTLGDGLVTAAGLGGYGILVALWLQRQRNRAAVIDGDRRFHDDFRTRQAAWQRDEWAKVPADAELWQLIHFTGAFDENVKAACLTRIQALPDLDTKMDALLRTDNAQHVLRYITHDYPRSRAPLAPALSPFLDRECERWGEQLRTAEQPESWLGNVLGYVECGLAVLHDGGDVRASLVRWQVMLADVRGLGRFARDLGARIAGTA